MFLFFSYLHITTRLQITANSWFPQCIKSRDKVLHYILSLHCIILLINVEVFISTSYYLQSMKLYNENTVWWPWIKDWAYDYELKTSPTIIHPVHYKQERSSLCSSLFFSNGQIAKMQQMRSVWDLHIWRIWPFFIISFIYKLYQKVTEWTVTI